MHSESGHSGQHQGCMARSSGTVPDGAGRTRHDLSGSRVGQVTRFLLILILAGAVAYYGASLLALCLTQL